MTWCLAPAFFGAGTVLIGPADAPTGGTCAVIPPGAWAREPDGADPNFSRDGWRVACWAAGRLIDDHRPLEVEHLHLAGAHEYVAARYEEGLGWMKAVLRDQIHALYATATKAAPGVPLDRRDSLGRAALLEMDAEAVFGEPVYHAMRLPVGAFDLDPTPTRE